MSNSKSLNPLLFGASIGMSWIWGLGLFFSVQFAFQFGLRGLLSFAISNAIGLFLFGYGVARISKNEKSLEEFFFKWSKPYKNVIYFYQLLAVVLTFFAIARYFLLPVIPVESLFIFPLAVILLVIIAVFLGENFSIKHIKKSHFVMLIIAFICMFTIVLEMPIEITDRVTFLAGNEVASGMYWGYLLPMFSGFLVGPWLDIQQWQKAIQLQKENTSITKSYAIGACLFFLIIIFHGILSIIVSQNPQGLSLVSVGIDGNYYAHAIITYFFKKDSVLIIAYSVFIVLCILSTLDSSYVALKWYLKKTIGESKVELLSFIPKEFAVSPFVHLFSASISALVGVYFEFELIYFILFYCSFFVVYSIQAIARAYKYTTKIPDVRLFLIALCSLAIVAFGCFLKMPLLLSVGSVVAILPAIYVGKEFISLKKTELLEVKGAKEMNLVRIYGDNAGSDRLTSESIEGEWYVHSFTPVYYNSNSADNVYSEMYPVWVGKARELFFNHYLPDFNLKKADYYILTKKFEHNYVNEIKGFEQIQVKIRVKSYTREVAILEHKIMANAIVCGTGQQTLLFVSSKDYSPINVPEEIVNGMLEFL